MTEEKEAEQQEEKVGQTKEEKASAKRGPAKRAKADSAIVPIPRDDAGPEAAGAQSPAVDAAVKAVMKLSIEERKLFIAKYVGGLSVLELSDQVKALEEAFGVSAAPAGMMMAMPMGAGAAEGAAEVEQTAFDVVLKEVGDTTRRVQVIKTVRDVLSVALKEAKAFVDGAPGTVKEGVSREEAEKIKAELEAAGATVEIK